MFNSGNWPQQPQPSDLFTQQQGQQYSDPRQQMYQQQFAGLQAQQQQQQNLQSSLPQGQANAQRIAQLLNKEQFSSLSPQQQQAIQQHIYRSQQGIGLGFPSTTPTMTPSNQTNNQYSSLQGYQTPSTHAASPIIPTTYSGQTSVHVSHSQAPTASNIPTQVTSQVTNITPSVAAFYKSLGEFYSVQKRQAPSPLVVDGKVVDLTKVFIPIVKIGGLQNMNTSYPNFWKQVLPLLGLGEPTDPQAERRSQEIQKYFTTFVNPFQIYLQAQRQKAAQQITPSNPLASTITNQTPATPTSTPLSTFPNLSSVAAQPPISQPSTSLPLTDSNNASKPMKNLTPNSTPSIPALTTNVEARELQVPVKTNQELVKKASSTVIEELEHHPVAVNTGKRKRSIYEYVPMARVIETYGGWDLEDVESAHLNIDSSTKPRTMADLGISDVQGWILSLRSRLGSEVAYALNSLTIVTLSMKIGNEKEGIDFSLSKCGDLLDELVELATETAFGEQFEPDSDDEEQKEASRLTPSTYREQFRLAQQTGRELASPPSRFNIASVLSDAGTTPLKPQELLLSIVNVLRNLVLLDENARFMAKSSELIEILARLTQLPLESREDATKISRILHLTVVDSLSIKKDILEMMAHMGHYLHLENYPLSAITGIFRLLAFFLKDADATDPLAFSFGYLPTSIAKQSQAPRFKISDLVETALGALARIGVLDKNRALLRQVCGVDLLELFESLVRILPISEEDFQLVTTENGLTAVENLSLSLYNLAFIAPTSVKKKLRSNPGIIRSLFRIIKRLAGRSDVDAGPFGILVDQCVSILKLLNDVDEGATVSTEELSDSLWWGRGPNPDWEERIPFARPTLADKGSVKAQQPPRTKMVQQPSILSGESRQMLEMLIPGSVAVAFQKVSQLIDPKGDTPK